MRRFFMSAVLLLAAGFGAAADGIPPLGGSPVVDTAQVLSAREREELNAFLTATSEQTGVQVAVLTVPTLNGKSIEDFGIAAAESWGLGQKGADNGVLLTVAMQEREVRIDVGYGLEGTLTDTTCGLIIRQSIIPAFRAGDYAAGIKAALEQIVAVATEGATIAPQENEGDSPADFIIPLVMFALFFGIVASAQGYGFLAYRLWLALLTGRPARRTIYPRTPPTSGHDPYGAFTGGSPHSRSSGFGGPHGGGHFGGGGGHFGGGGASGKW